MLRFGNYFALTIQISALWWDGRHYPHSECPDSLISQTGMAGFFDDK